MKIFEQLSWNVFNVKLFNNSSVLYRDISDMILRLYKKS